MIEDIINSNKILNYEKRGIRLILLIGIISVMSSCSVIYRSIDFVSESDHWKRDPPSYYYMYTNNTDSIGIWALGTDMSRDVAIFSVLRYSQSFRQLFRYGKNLIGG